MTERSVRRTTTLSILLSLGLTASAATSAQANNYDTAISCAGGLQFMAAMLPAGSEPAADAKTRGAAWQTEAERVSQKNQSATQSDIHAAKEKTKTIMMSGDQTAIAAYFGPLNDTCAALPTQDVAGESVENPFDLKNPTRIENFDRAVMCAGRYAIDGNNGDAEAKIRHTRFRDYALETFPKAEEKAVDDKILKATSEWMMAVLNLDDKSLAVIDICNRGYANLD